MRLAGYAYRVRCNDRSDMEAIVIAATMADALDLALAWAIPEGGVVERIEAKLLAYTVLAAQEGA